jgi:hypothetical protein
MHHNNMPGPRRGGRQLQGEDKRIRETTTELARTDRKENCKARKRRRGEKRAAVFGLCVTTGRFCAHMFLKFHLICCIF